MSEVLQGDNLEVLKGLPDKFIDCCVTSPPYYGLRDYGTGNWVGGDPDCHHKRINDVCPLCGAVREDKQIGLEDTPEEYVNRLVDVFREVKRVLKDDGTLWLNIGDTYNGAKQGNTEMVKHKSVAETNEFEKKKWSGAKSKDLLGIPWMLAFALRDDGWYLRQDIIWHKPNPMPEPVKDRCVKSHEYVFLLSKKPHYYFDYEAIQENAVCKNDRRHGEGRIAYDGKRADGIDDKAQRSFVKISDKRNKRDVWSVTTKAVREAHFATFPEDLIKPCILAGSRVGGVVLDPFFGSGTTGRVAVANGREYLGIELNPEYIEISNRRTNNVQITLSSLMGGDCDV